MVDIASIGLKVDSSQVDKGVNKLDNLADAGERAETGVKKTEGATKSLQSSVNALINALNNNTNSTNSNTSAMGANANAHNKAATAAKNQSNATDELSERMQRLKASVQPFAAAQDQANAELAEARALFEAGSLSAQEYAMYQSTLATRVQKYGEAQMRANTMIVNGGKAAKLTAHEALNLSRQFADIGVTAAMGMNPLMILIQQGPQIYDIMKTSGLGIKDIGVELLKTLGIVRQVENVTDAASLSAQKQAASNVEVGVTANAAAAAETRLAGASLEAAGASSTAAAAGEAQAAANSAVAATGARARVVMTGTGVALAAVATAAAVFTGVMAVGAKEISDGYGDVAAKMGLTEKQMERVKESGISTTVTLGDTISAFFEITGERLYDAFEGPITWLQETIGTAYDWVVEKVDWATGETIGLWFGAYRAVTATWSLLPSAMGDLAYSAANNTISAIEYMVNAAIDRLNQLAQKANSILPEFAQLGEMGNINLGRIENPYEGQAGKAYNVGRQAFAEGQQEGRDAYGRFKDDVANRAIEKRKQAILEEAGDAGRNKKTGKNEEDKRLKAAQDFLDALKKETEEIGKNRIELKMMEVERAALEAPTKALSNAIREAGEAWKKATFAEETRKFKEELGDLVEEQKFETEILSLNIKEREIAIAQREIDLKLREYERQGIEINTEAIKAETDAIRQNAEAKGQRKLDAEAAKEYADEIERMTESLRRSGDMFNSAFGSSAVGDMIDVLADYYDFQAEQEQRLAEIRAEYGEQSIEYLKAQTEARQEAADLEIESMDRIIGGVKNMFGQKSAAYKAMAAIEKVYAAIRLANMLKEIVFEGVLTSTKVSGAATRMATDTVETGSSVANSATRASADGVAAFAKTLASLPFPFNLAAGAAVLAALISVGVKMGGGGGKSSKASTASEADIGETYNGPRDQYGNPTSHYSVLRPGETTVAGTGNGYSRAQMPSNDNAAGFGNITFGDTNLTIQGDVRDDNTVAQVEQLLKQNREQTVQEARQAAAADRANASQRQRIGGAQ